jgi:hypothetical protein
MGIWWLALSATLFIRIEEGPNKSYRLSSSLAHSSGEAVEY